MAVPRYVAIANPDSLRWKAYERDLIAFWRGRGVEPDVTVVPWAMVVECDGNFDDMPAFDRPAVERLESPGRDWPVTQLLLAAGGARPADDDTDWLRLDYRKGRLRPGLFHAGFCRVLRGLRRSFDARGRTCYRPPARWRWRSCSTSMPPHLACRPPAFPSRRRCPRPRRRPS
ncbi:MAG: hypothetical protein U0736_07135 [Gemmataceae bacterium]